MMDTVVGIAVYTSDEGMARRAMDAAFNDMHWVASTTDKHAAGSTVAWINSHEWTDYPRLKTDMAAIIGQGLEVCRMSDGAYDISIGRLTDLWSFEEGAKLPTEAQIKEALELVDWSRLRLHPENQNMFVLPYRMQLDLYGIAKGFAVDQAVRALEAEGVTAGLVDAGGDIRLIGAGPDGAGWKVGIKHPRKEGLLGVLSLEGGSVATSGDYQRYMIIDGVRYHHILDPSTGYPARGAISVTVTAADCVYADALATAVFVMGAEDGMRLVEETDGIEAVIVTGAEEVGEILVSSGLEGKFVRLEGEEGADVQAPIEGDDG